MEMTREQFLRRLVDIAIHPQRHRVPARPVSRARRYGGGLPGLYARTRCAIEFFGDEIERITRFEPLTGHKLETLEHVTIYPGKQFVTPSG